MKNDFGGLLVGGGEPTYFKLKEVEKLAVRHFNYKQGKHAARVYTLGVLLLRLLICWLHGTRNTSTAYL